MTEENNKKSSFSKLTQVGIVVKDMDATIKKLTSFGIGPFEHRSIPAEAREWYRDKPMNASFRIAAVNVGGVELEFIQPVEGESPHQAFLDQKGEGIQHLAFAVENLEEDIEIAFHCFQFESIDEFLKGLFFMPLLLCDLFPLSFHHPDL